MDESPRVSAVLGALLIKNDAKGALTILNEINQETPNVLYLRGLAQAEFRTLAEKFPDREWVIQVHAHLK